MTHFVLRVFFSTSLCLLSELKMNGAIEGGLHPRPLQICILTEIKLSGFYTL